MGRIRNCYSTLRYNDTFLSMITDMMSKQKEKHLEGLQKEIESTEKHYDDLIEQQQERLKLLDEEVEKEDRLAKLREIDENAPQMMGILYVE
ncbi:hypothetical protein [Cytobacillus purgationiresistens]|uniref:Ribosome quality control (RQC) complex YloA/Tae2 family protein n=1 Tax=Cytobacillus purgationiresistens TaxID=863449 RepID=A0ABU0ABN4_9BACI|nr:hypothetical protein [Cytobacillus purgationiresistens]MDQ0268662.1 putative ribosome quality control (RQC) complex YloA/Tae2 family protein [Cytobacillus purgationiresistens]